MAITKSAKRAIRVSGRRRVKNLLKMKKIKNLLKEVKSLVSQKKTEEAKKLLPQVYKVLDKAAKTGLLKKNTVARKKSRITILINKVQ
jgi:small subunit ribosomal protein S20